MGLYVLKGGRVFYTRIKANPVNPRARKVKPYFPGDMFVKANQEEVRRSKFRWMPHSLGLVRFDDDSAHVPDTLGDIRRTVNEIAEAGGEKFIGLQPVMKFLMKKAHFLVIGQFSIPKFQAKNA